MFFDAERKVRALRVEYTILYNRNEASPFCLSPWSVERAAGSPARTSGAGITDALPVRGILPRALGARMPGPLVTSNEALSLSLRHLTRNATLRPHPCYQKHDIAPRLCYQKRDTRAHLYY